MMQLPVVSIDPNLSIALILCALFPIFIVLVVRQWKAPPPFPTGIPRVGRKKISGGLGVCFRGWFSWRQSLSEGYNKYNQHDRAFTYATGNLRPQVILPAKDFEWMLRQPDSVLSHREVMNENISFRHLFSTHFPMGISALDKSIGSIIASQDLTQNIDRIQSGLADELRRNIDREFGTDCHNWQPVRLVEVMQRVLLGVTSWISWGLPLGRDAAYVRYLAKLINFQSGAMMVSGQLTPWFLQPLLTTFLKVPLHFAQQRVWAVTAPVIKKWLVQIEQEERERISEKDSRVPYTAVTAFIRTARRLYGPKKLNEEKLSLLINLFTVLPFMTTVPTSAAAIMDIASSPAETGLHQRLRQEAATVLRSEKEWADPMSFKRLHYINSAVLESLRLTPVALHASIREVVHPSGITLPAGQHLPQGMWVAASTLDIHTDKRFYPEGQSYQPFRFLKEQTADDSTSPSKETNTEDTGAATQKVTKVATTSTYLPFGSGRHACPGRHFGVHLLKMIVAYIVLNYDIEYLDKRPENVTCGEHIFVPTSATVRVRRRQVN